MHRLFTGLPVPEPLVERLRLLRTDLPGARWRREDQLHVTLQFYGEVHQALAEEIADQLGRVARPPVPLALQGVGWFGRREPQAIHARIAPNEALSDLARACRQIARRLNLKTGAEPFLPHITLAYCYGTPLAEVEAWSEDFFALRSEPVQIDAFNLYESFLGRARSHYQVQGHFRLA
jgi:2'-5' RNA ligase